MRTTQHRRRRLLILRSLLLPLLVLHPRKIIVRGLTVMAQRSNIPRTLDLHLLTLYKCGHLRRRRIDGAEAENVQQEHAAVVEEMADGLSHELQVRIGQEGNLLDAVDAVDPRQDAQHREVPVLVDEVVDEVVEADGGEGHVVGVEGWGRGVGGEEFDVEGVGGVDGDHGFGVVVEVFEEDFTQGVDLAAGVRAAIAAAAAAAIAGEEVALLFEGAEEGVEFADDGDVGGEFGVFG